VAKAIFGMKALDSGLVYVRGEERTIRHPRDAIALGVAYVPEDRDEEGIILDMDVSANITLPILRSCSRWGWLDPERERSTAAEYAGMLEVKSAGLEQKVVALSGGNKQKVSLAKWLASKCKLLILDEPTKGIDVGSKAAVHGFISELASKGCGIVMISSELPEIMGMADSILVMHEGAVKGRFEREGTSEEDILAAALSDDSAGDNA
jgi:rhamnose transport system ATP-binding protein